MYKILLCHRRRGGFDAGAIHRHWRTTHERTVLALQPELGYVRYAQLHQVCRANVLYQGIRATRSRLVTSLLGRKRGVDLPDRPVDRGVQREERWDVVDELWYPSRAAMLAALTSPRGRAAAQRLREAQDRWVRRTAIVIAEELVVTAPPASRSPVIRATFCLRRRPELTREIMLSYWGGSHRDLVLHVGDAMKFVGYDQLHTRSDADTGAVVEILGGSAGEEYDGVAGLTFADQGVLWKGLFSLQTQKANLTLVGDEITFIDGENSSLVFGERHDVYPLAGAQRSEGVEDLAQPEQRPARTVRR